MFFIAILIKVINTFSKLSEIRGNRKLAVVLLGIDSFLFLMVFKRVMTNTSTLPVVVMLSVGFMVGYILGGKLEEYVALGNIAATIKVAKKDSKVLFKRLEDAGFIFTRTKRIYTHTGIPVKLYHGILFRKELPKLKKCLKGLDHITYTETVSGVFGKKLIRTKK
jgi:uncharacterized protein YebE (UPF0316 family)